MLARDFPPNLEFMLCCNVILVNLETTIGQSNVAVEMVERVRANEPLRRQRDVSSYARRNVA